MEGEANLGSVLWSALQLGAFQPFILVFFSVFLDLCLHLFVLGAKNENLFKDVKS